MAATKSTKKPVLFFTAFPAEGHANPQIKVAHGLIARGYEVVFHCGRSFEARILAIGATFAEAPEMPGPEVLGEIETIPLGIKREVFALTKVFLESIPARADSLEAALADLRARRGPDTQIIIMSELCALGPMVFKFGRPPPPGFEHDGFPKVIGLSSNMLVVTSIDTAPYLFGLPPDSTESGRLRNAALHQLLIGPDGPMHSAITVHRAKLLEAGADPDKAPKDENFTDIWTEAPDVTLQMCLPEQEYPLSDLTPKIKFVGCLPRREPQPHDVYPEWWDEVVVANAKKEAGAGGRKKVVFVSQGTVALDYTQLVVPTLEAFKDRADDVIVIAALGARGAALPPDVEVPPNARVVDYLPYDTALQHADVMVSNAGYGALCHAVVNGVPLVLAGETQDKKEGSMRAAAAGYALGLWTQVPTVEQVRGGVDAVLADARFKERAVELRRLNDEMRCLDKIEEWVEKYTV